MVNKSVWIRVAGNAANIKASHPHGWRCYIEGDPREIALTDWKVSGQATHTNCISGFSATKDSHGLTAWIDFFGSYVIENDVLHIVFGIPAVPPGNKAQ